MDLDVKLKSAFQIDDRHRKGGRRVLTYIDNARGTSPQARLHELVVLSYVPRIEGAAQLVIDEELPAHR
jgi:hypothetical protein